MPGPTFFPTETDEAKMTERITASRDYYVKHRPSNLVYLWKNRFEWMNQYISSDDFVVELGAGIGLSREFIDAKNLIVTDYVKYPWIDRRVDALNLPYENESVDVFICANMIHHLAKPSEFLRQITGALKVGGYLLVRDTYPSLALRTMMWLMKNEGWSYDVDVFDKDALANDPRDAWSGNSCIPALLFKDGDNFTRHIPRLKIVSKEPSEFLMFPLSGGTIYRSFTLNLPQWALKLIDKLDNALVRLSPGLFALSYSVAIKKIR